MDHCSQLHVDNIVDKDGTMYDDRDDTLFTNSLIRDPYEVDQIRRKADNNRLS